MYVPMAIIKFHQLKVKPYRCFRIKPHFLDAGDLRFLWRTQSRDHNTFNVLGWNVKLVKTQCTYPGLQYSFINRKWSHTYVFAKPHFWTQGTSSVMENTKSRSQYFHCTWMKYKSSKRLNVRTKGYNKVSWTESEAIQMFSYKTTFFGRKGHTSVMEKPKSRSQYFHCTWMKCKSSKRLNVRTQRATIKFYQLKMKLYRCFCKTTFFGHKGPQECYRENKV